MAKKQPKAPKPYPGVPASIQGPYKTENKGRDQIVKEKHGG